MRTLGDIQPGQTLGRYEFLVPIAQGGMAAVWAARLKGTRGFSKTVAIKTMLPTISDDPHFEQMFLDEAGILARIRHPNVGEIFDLGEQDDLLYIVMEWVDGEPLSAIRRAAAKAQQAIPLNVGVKVIQDACAGLHAAHELRDDGGLLLNLVHRDVSPQNLLVTFDGVVKVVDFGVARVADRGAEHTDAGQIKGKPSYMSPEQAMGQVVDRRTDVFALGIVLYQLTTGKHPFRGENDGSTLHNIVSDRPVMPPRSLDPEYPKPLEAVVMRALDRDPSKRYQTAAELEVALDRAFPPTMPRVRSEDVGRYVNGLLGSRGEERRAALREAIRLADERAQRGEEFGPVGLRPLAEVGRHSLVSATGHPPPSHHSVITAAMPPPPGLPNLLGGSGPVSDAPATAPSGIVPTPFGTQTPTTPPRPERRSMAAPIAIALGLLAAGGVAAIVIARGGGEAPPAPASLPTSEVPVAAATTPAPAPAPAAASASGEPGALSVDSLPTLGSPSPGRGDPPPRGGAKAAPEKTAEPPPATAKPPTKRPGGFVPPKVTDPGF
ncbi:MAG: serine/threonine protein kinase [Polyangiaceae bacterium]|nr:serine/threonine protein kinase [Polyangiaceae bacterium]